MIQGIQLAISKMIKEMGIYPNTIRMHPADLNKLKSDVYHYGKLECGEISTILGLKIIETTKTKEGTCELYNDKVFTEVTFNYEEKPNVCDKCGQDIN